jgi:ribulose 1,5-bisphosphate synthetase/thiazole synthase
VREYGHCDVLVAGGGPAGIAAAIAAARAGAAVTLLEEKPFVGGNATLGLPLMTFHAFAGEQIIGGVPQELVERLVEAGGSTGHVQTGPGAHMPTYTLVDAEVLKYVAQQLLLEAGVRVLLHALVVDALVRGSAARGVVVAAKPGLGLVTAERVVDCTGDADVAARAGAPFVKGRPEDGGMQAMTLNFRLTNVDLDKITQFFGEGLVTGRKPGEVAERPIRGQGTFAPWDDLPETRGLFPDRNHHLWWNSLREGEVNINTTRIVGKDPTEFDGLTEAEIEGRQQVFRVVRFLRQHVPGFEQANLVSTGSQIGVRETRRILGEYTLTAEDVLNARRFPDGIAQGSYPIDIHDPSGQGWGVQFVKDGGAYDIPYRCLIPQRLENLLVAGRSISADHQAMGSVRVMATCMAMGQAAGAAATLSLQTGRSPRRLDVDRLRDLLRSQGAKLS